MKVKATINMDVDLKDIAEQLAKSPEDFARFWFHFADATGHGIGNRTRGADKADLEEFGKVMAGDSGGMRKEPFYKIYDAMRHHERLQASGASGGYK